MRGSYTTPVSRFKTSILTLDERPSVAKLLESFANKIIPSVVLTHSTLNQYTVQCTVVELWTQHVCILEYSHVNGTIIVHLKCT